MDGSAPPPSLERLLAQGRWLRRLAVCLAGEHAEDAVQETWTAALRSPPDPARPPRAWLATVMRNLLRSRARAEGTRRAHASAAGAADEPLAESAAELLERVELQRILTTLVTELEEPLRATLVLAFYEGRSLAQIARALGVPEGTVRWRKHEALKRLRARMDARYGGRRSWLVLVLPWSAEEGRARSPRAPVIVVAAVATVVGVLAIWGWNRLGARHSAPAVEHKDRTSALSPLPRLVPAGWGDETFTDVGDASIEGVVRGPAGRPAPGATVLLVRAPVESSGGALARLRPVAVARSDQEGRFRFMGLTSGPLSVAASAEVGTPARLDLVLGASSRTRVDLVLGAGGALLTGRVLDADGGPIARAEVRVTVPNRLRSPGADRAPGLLAAWTDGTGRYRFRLAPGAWRLIAEAEGYTAETASLQLRGDDVRELRLEPAARLEGRVVDGSTGRPIAGAVIFSSARQGLGSRSVVSGSAGAFTLGGLPPGDHQVWARKDDLVGTSATVELFSGETLADLPIVLERGHAVGGRVVAAQGPVAGAQVIVQRRDPPYLRGLAVASDAAGVFVVGPVPPGRYDVEVLADGHAPARETAIVDGDRRDVEVRLAPEARVVGRVTSTHGRPAAGAHVRVTVDRPGGAAAVESATTDDDGRFSIGRLPAGQLRVVTEHDGYGGQSLGPEPLGDAETRALTVTLVPPASVSGTVRFTDGSPAIGARVRALGTATVGPAVSVPCDQDGRYHLEGLPSGALVLAAARAGEPRHSRDPGESPARRRLTLSPGGRLTSVDLMIPSGGSTLGGRVTDGQDRPVAGALVDATPSREGALAGASPHTARTRSAADGSFMLRDLDPVTYDLRARSPGKAVAAAGDVRGGSMGVKLVLVPAARVEGMVIDTRGTPVTAYSLQATQADRAVRLPIDVLDHTGAFGVTGLGPGGYQFRVRTATGATGAATVALVAGQHARGVRIVVMPPPTRDAGGAR